MSDTPELDKMHAVHERSQAIGEFLDWLGNERSQRVVLCVWHKHDDSCGKNEYGGHPDCDINENFPVSIHEPIEHLLAEFFGIDLKKVEREKRALLKMAREAQAK